MARPRRLAPAALAACRLEYETTPITSRDLAAKYGISKSALSERAGIEGWLRLNPRQPKRRRPGRAEMAVRAAVQVAEDMGLLRGLTRALDDGQAKPDQQPHAIPDKTRWWRAGKSKQNPRRRPVISLESRFRDYARDRAYSPRAPGRPIWTDHGPRPSRQNRPRAPYPDRKIRTKNAAG